MRDEIDIYHYRHLLEMETDRVRKSGICTSSKNLLLDYKDYLIARGLGLARTIKCLSTLRAIATMFPKRFDAATKKDIIGLINAIEARQLSEYTKHDYKLIFKQFFKWLKGTDEYPDLVKWIKVKKPKNRLLPEELLTTEEVKAMIRAADNPRDRAFIGVLYESACRIGEMLTLKIKHVHQDEYGAKLIVDGKTGPRRVRIISSSPLLATWLNHHLDRENPEAPVWISASRGKTFGIRGADEMLKHAAQKAGVNKRIHPHLFRHSRLTELARLGFNEFQLRTFAGWAMDSDEAAVYVHMSGRDVDDALLRINGIEKEHKEEEAFRGIECQRCKVKNSPEAKYCNGCGLAFDVKYAMELDERKEDIKEKIEMLSEELAKSPEIVDKLLNALAIVNGKVQTEHGKPKRN